MQQGEGCCTVKIPAKRPILSDHELCALRLHLADRAWRPEVEWEMFARVVGKLLLDTIKALRPE